MHSSVCCFAPQQRRCCELTKTKGCPWSHHVSNTCIKNQGRGGSQTYAGLSTKNNMSQLWLPSRCRCWVLLGKTMLHSGQAWRAGRTWPQLAAVQPGPRRGEEVICVTHKCSAEEPPALHLQLCMLRLNCRRVFEDAWAAAEQAVPHPEDSIVPSALSCVAREVTCLYRS